MGFRSQRPLFCSKDSTFGHVKGNIAGVSARNVEVSSGYAISCDRGRKAKSHGTIQNHFRSLPITQKVWSIKKERKESVALRPSPADEAMVTGFCRCVSKNIKCEYSLVFNLIDLPAFVLAAFVTHPWKASVSAGRDCYAKRTHRQGVFGFARHLLQTTILTPLCVFFLESWYLVVDTFSSIR